MQPSLERTDPDRFRRLLALGTLLTISACAGVMSEDSRFAGPASIPGASRVGDVACESCHPAESAAFGQTAHARVSSNRLVDGERCESCHGEGSRHVQLQGRRDQIRRFGASTEPAAIEAPIAIVGYRDLEPFARSRASGFCLDCHSGAALFEWPASGHERAGLSCVDCHDPMRPATKLLRAPVTELCASCHSEIRAKLQLPSHHPVEEGRVRCVDCHDPHGSSIAALVRAPSSLELCLGCHSEKAGPFLFEHPPVTESCALCHEPHGTVSDFLTREPDPFLCLGCHAGHQGPLSPLTDVLLNASKRATFLSRCTACHSSIHGTDLASPSGHGRFTR